MHKNIAILGVSGSIGKSALKILHHFPQLRLRSFSVHNNIECINEIIQKYSPEYFVITSESAYQLYIAQFPQNKKMVLTGKEGIDEIALDQGHDIVLNAITGKAGLYPSLKILENGIDLALANKESIVCAGEVLTTLAEQHFARIIPVDSEHSAIFYLLKDKSSSIVEKIILTASGGPFYQKEKSEWYKISREQALKHPTWQMGNKITIDSATMANKGLEVIEAHYLFNMNYEQIDVVIHPQSLIHSMVETIDGELYAQIGPNDMSLPIQNALFYPELKANQYLKLDLTKGIKLEILPMDYDKFKMLQYAFQCGKAGGVYPAFYNFVNEYLVELFLTDKISFLQIEEMMNRAIDHFAEDQTVDKKDVGTNNINQVDQKAHSIVKEILKI
ncbi:MAG: 1-deoxy-D-xylulose-5-phosphate reductoisomerase [Spirochaetes bacterium]|nr:1-deoxy-D-xylulose-5-phosphate reductoisomerase [Spirochaetota bacterium]